MTLGDLTDPAAIQAATRLVVDGVLTTGASMQTERMYGDRGVVIFARTRHIPDSGACHLHADLADAR